MQRQPIARKLIKLTHVRADKGCVILRKINAKEKRAVAGSCLTNQVEIEGHLVEA